MDEFKRRVNDKGYVELYFPEHPMSNKGGWCLEHRRVLWEHSSPGDQPCYWCGWLLPWKVDNGRDNWKQCINVDHLNEDRQDNRITNLVPSCWWCNANRSWSRIAPLMWQRARREFLQVPPNERPAMILWLAARAEEGLKPAGPRDPTTGRAILGNAARGDKALQRLAEAFPNETIDLAELTDGPPA